MNADQQNRFDIMQALEKVFPDRLLEDLIEVARYVEAGGITRAREESQDSAAKSLEEADDISAPRTWTNLDDIPDNVWAATDRDGDVIRRVLFEEGDLSIWAFEAELYGNIVVTDDHAPFTEVLDD